jgi:hypothetical protein
MHQASLRKKRALQERSRSAVFCQSGKLGQVKNTLRVRSQNGLGHSERERSVRQSGGRINFSLPKSACLPRQATEQALGAKAATRAPV